MQFLLAYWLYIDGVDTVVRMAANFAFTLGFDQSSIMGALVLIQLVAFFATLIYVKIANYIGLKNGIYLGIFGYCIIFNNSAFPSGVILNTCLKKDPLFSNAPPFISVIS